MSAFGRLPSTVRRAMVDTELLFLGIELLDLRGNGLDGFCMFLKRRGGKLGIISHRGDRSTLIRFLR